MKLLGYVKMIILDNKQRKYLDCVTIEVHSVIILMMSMVQFSTGALLVLHDTSGAHYRNCSLV